MPPSQRRTGEAAGGGSCRIRTSLEPIIRFRLRGEPVAKGRPRVNQRTGTVYTPAKTRAAERRIAEAVRKLLPLRKPDEALYVIDARFWLGTQRRTDGDNLVKMVLDGLSASKRLWADDSQVVEWHTYLWRGSHDPRTEVAVWRLPTGTRPPLLTPLG